MDSYKEGRKSYEEALDRARTELGNCGSNEDAAKRIYAIFPELCESEDERIRKELIEFIRHGNCVFDSLEQKNKFWAWLEKQGGQKPIDKIEPKFKVGDWIISDEAHEDYRICKITKVENGNYTIESIYGYKGYNTFETFEKDFHLWAIRDAKDGDVLYLQHEGVEHVIIYKGLVKKNFNTVLSAYCAYNGFVHDFCFADVSSYACITSERDEKEIHPATKEQREQLEKAMADAGYTFDFEKKELNKIEQKPDTDFSDLRTWKYIVDAVLTEKEGIGQYLDSPYTEEVAKKLQKRFGNIGQNPTWSEEDEKMLKEALRMIEKPGSFFRGTVLTEKVADWLKSLKERYTWKPTDEQIKALLKLEEMHVLEHEKNQENAYLYMVIKSLKEQLLKLKGK